MQIEIPNEQYTKLIAVANAAGYADVIAFASSLVEEPTVDPRGRLSDEELRNNAAECDRAIAEMKAE